MEPWSKISRNFAYGNSITAKIVGGTHVEIIGTFVDTVICGSLYTMVQQ